MLSITTTTIKSDHALCKTSDFGAGQMAELASLRWQGDAAEVGEALRGANQVRSVDELHLALSWASLAIC
jgi:hypothetical protein